jgi:NAD(P)H dehydrogenase (quinone)
MSILIVYFTRHGSIGKMAEYIARGALMSKKMKVIVRTIPTINNHSSNTIQYDNPPYVTHEDIINSKALILGSPGRFGNMAAEVKYFLDNTIDIWITGGLANKPAGVFTSTSTMHGGQESTLLSMMLPLLHHGAFIVGIPYTDNILHTTKTGGTPYGPSHYAGVNNDLPLSDDEIHLCKVFGKRIAELAYKLNI